MGPEFVKVPFCKQCGIYITREGLNLDYKVGDKNISREIQINIQKLLNVFIYQFSPKLINKIAKKLKNHVGVN